MRIIIELNEAGQLLVNGDCLQNKVIAIGMLEMAKGMIAGPQAQKTLLDNGVSHKAS